MKLAGFAVMTILLAAPAGAKAEDAAQAIASCLDQPSRNCALASALQVTAEEELAIVRVDSLIAIADSLAQLGDFDRARSAAALAREAADDIGISIGTEQKHAEIVPVLAAIGDIDQAIALADTLGDRLLRANALGLAAITRARAGNQAEAERLLDLIDNPVIAMRHAVDLAEALAETGQDGADSDRLLDRLTRIDNRLLRAIGYSRIAVLEARAGRTDEALALAAKVRDALDYIVMPDGRARLYAALAAINLALGDRDAFEDDATRAATLTKGIRSDLDRIAALSDVIASLSAGGRIAEAVELASGIEDLRDLGTLIERLAERRISADAVLPIAGHIEAALARSESRFERDRSRLSLARALAASGAIIPAIRIIGTIETDDQQARALAALAPALAPAYD